MNPIARFFIITGCPTVMFLLINYIYFFRGKSFLRQVHGILGTLVTSFMSFYALATVLYRGLTPYLVEPFGKYEDVAATILSVILFMGLYIFFAHIYQMWVARSTSAGHPVAKGYGFFLYTQYLIVTIICMIMSQGVVMMIVSPAVLYLIWLLVFRNDFSFLIYTYPKKTFSPINLSLVFEYLFVMLFWIAPSILFDISETSTEVRLNTVLSILAVMLFFFGMINHKLMFLEAYHEFRELQSISSDELTGLTSRNFFETKAQEIIDTRLKNEAYKPAIIFFNLAEFKYYNQMHGKEESDYLLKQTAKHLTEVFGMGAGVSRLSDDHFVVMTVRVETIDSDIITLNRLLMREFGNISLKAGIYLVRSDDKDIHQVIDNAKIACDSIKNDQNQLFKYFDADNARVLALSHYVLDNVDRAVREKLLTVYYQPIHDVNTGKIISGEALIRWNDDNHGFLSPDSFIPTLEARNLTYKIDCFVIEQVCKDHRYLLDLIGKSLPVAINFSRKDFFLDFDMVDFLENTRKKYDIPIDLIKVEITESALTGDDNHVRDEVARIRSLGYKVWMDDFGSGYSSLNTLGNFEFDGIKLDMVFLRNMSQKNRFIIQSIVNATKDLGLSVLMEGVETEEHFEFLQQIGCDNAQGFLLGKPQPLADLLHQYQGRIAEN